MSLPKQGSGKSNSTDKKRNRSLYTKEDILKALEDIEVQGISIREAGRRYKIPETTLRQKKKGVYDIDTFKGPHPIFSKNEEEILINFINSSYERSHPVTKKNVMDAAKIILHNDLATGFDRKLPHSAIPGEVGKKWWRLFCGRNPKLPLRTLESWTLDRRNLSADIIKSWFEKLKCYLSDQECCEILNDQTRIFNFDEIVFRFKEDVGRVILLKGEKTAFEENSTDAKINVTVLSMACADGRVPPPYIIYPYLQSNEDILHTQDYKYEIGNSFSGNINSENILKYVTNSFDNWLTEQQIKKPILIFTDWHESRSNFKLVEMLKNKDIIMYGLPPNMTHFMNPLNICVFSQLKQCWDKTIYEWEIQNQESGAILNIQNFAHAYMPAYYSFATSEMIKFGFRKCCLYPFNPFGLDFSELESISALKENKSFVSLHKEISEMKQSPDGNIFQDDDFGSIFTEQYVEVSMNETENDTEPRNSIFGPHCASCGIYSEFQEEIVPQITNGAMLELHQFFKHQEHNLPKVFQQVSILMGDFNSSYADFYNKMQQTFLSTSSTFNETKTWHDTQLMNAFNQETFTHQNTHNVKTESNLHPSTPTTTISYAAHSEEIAALRADNLKKMKEVHKTALENLIQMNLLSSGGTCRSEEESNLIEEILERSHVGRDLNKDLEACRKEEDLKLKHKKQMMELLKQSRQSLTSVLKQKREMQNESKEKSKEIQRLEREIEKFENVHRKERIVNHIESEKNCYEKCREDNVILGNKLNEEGINAKRRRIEDKDITNEEYNFNLFASQNSVQDSHE